MANTMPSVTFRSPIKFNSTPSARATPAPHPAAAPQQAQEPLAAKYAAGNASGGGSRMEHKLRNPANKVEPSTPKDTSKLDPNDTKTPPVDGDGNKDSKGKFSLSSLGTEGKVAGAVGLATTGMTAFSMVSGAVTQAQMMAIQEQEKRHVVENEKMKSEVAGVTRDADLVNLVTQIK